jgi:hypothetical protein
MNSCKISSTKEPFESAEKGSWFVGRVVVRPAPPRCRRSATCSRMNTMPPKTVLHTSRGPSPPATPSAEVGIGGFVVTIEGNIAAGKVCVCVCVCVCLCVCVCVFTGSLPSLWRGGVRGRPNNRPRSCLRTFRWSFLLTAVLVCRKTGTLDTPTLALSSSKCFVANLPLQL